MIKVKMFNKLLTAMVLSLSVTSYSMDSETPENKEKPEGEKNCLLEALDKLYGREASLEEKVALINDTISRDLPPYNKQLLRDTVFHIQSSKWNTQLSPEALGALPALIVAITNFDRHADPKPIVQQFTAYLNVYGKDNVFIENTATVLRAYEYIRGNVYMLANQSALLFERYDFALCAHILDVLKLEEDIEADLKQGIDPLTTRANISPDLVLRKMLKKVLEDHDALIFKKTETCQ